MKIDIHCPTCDRSSGRFFIGVMNTTVHQMHCHYCRTLWRFIVEPDVFIGGLTVYTVSPDDKIVGRTDG